MMAFHNDVAGALTVTYIGIVYVHKRDPLCHPQKEHLYEEALYTVQYLLGASPPGYMADTRQLIDYLQQVSWPSYRAGIFMADHLKLSK